MGVLGHVASTPGTTFEAPSLEAEALVALALFRRVSRRSLSRRAGRHLGHIPLKRLWTILSHSGHCE